jgi:ABC-type lipoprotein export system ATPase subunit
MNSEPASSLELRGVACTRHGAAVEGLTFELTPRALHVLTSADGTNDLLLRLLGLLEIPDAGEVLFGRRNTTALDEPSRTELRTRSFGYVFAAPFLLPSFSVVENLAMPLFKLMETSPSEARTRAEKMLDFVGLRGREEERAGDLPAMQQHAAALARALITQPEVLIVEGLDRHLTGPELKHYRSLLRLAITRLGVTVIATASSDWKAEPEDQVLEVSERAVRAAAPVAASS